MTGTRWLDDDQQRAWRAYLRMQAELAARLGRQLQADSGLSFADYGVLVQLAEAPGGRLRPFALQRDLQWEQSRLSHHLGRMQRRGLVDREECPQDARGAFVVLTAAGRAAIEAAAPAHVDTVRRLVFDQLDPDEVRALERIATRVVDGLDAERRPA
ncbi:MULTISPECIES: MarR family winged helix-turn-helix transcriptional regulator [Micromonospora]|uniref:MarR family winged helix-turn-helix transcriptional regulator n=1 Tax=Micromonospora TaxID=1873 RepID=UPI00098D2FD6|nr:MULTISPECIES: MarR family winged helix-turn-helix transcriptional regulator [unclassified Micromonospora]MDI5940675.1 MarR family winged helix-turn-helix transcriptional regulator [Micromonospora sp. DH15]OON29173.1 MarR family transcriptional regulator [Micromonospora sp. Rc5]